MFYLNSAELIVARLPRPGQSLRSGGDPKGGSGMLCAKASSTSARFLGVDQARRCSKMSLISLKCDGTCPHGLS